MGDALIFFLLLVGLLAILTRDTFLVVLLYLVGGVTIISSWWTNTILTRLVFTRLYERHAFPGELIPVRVTIRNPTVLPAVWLHLQESIPVELVEHQQGAQIISLGPRERTDVGYFLRAQKRGFYTLGPMIFSTGDLLGLSAERYGSASSDTLLVYPRIIPFSQVPLPSNAPLGTIRHAQPIFEDPSRPFGKREYQSGDSLRRIDWKASASTGRLQTKVFQPSIALETMLFLNLNLNDYHLKTRYDATELAITIAASLANWITSQRQSSGLFCNGLDQRAPDAAPVQIPSGKGRAHLMRILETLACARAVETGAFPVAFRQQRVRLHWGATAIVITGSADQELLEELHKAKRGGLHPLLVLCGDHPDHRQASQRARLYGIPTNVFVWERDLDLWRS